jgi:hypothetical protein
MPPMATDAVARARRRFRPRRIRVLFVAEAPPADPTRFFYFENVRKGDSLFIELIRLLYPDARSLSAKDLRSRKSRLLEKFAADGYYLIDASSRSIPKGTTLAEKRVLLRVSLPTLLKDAKRLISTHTQTVLITRSVYDVCREPLERVGIRLLNTEMIDFPGSGNQLRFRKKLGRLLVRHGIATQRANKHRKLRSMR